MVGLTLTLQKNRINMNGLLRFFISFLCLATLIGCHQHSSLSKFERVDSFLAQHQDSLAWVKLQAIDTKKLGASDHAYFALLLTQAQYKNYIAPTNDSLICQAVDYYSHNEDREKYTRSLLY